MKCFYCQARDPNGYYCRITIAKSKEGYEQESTYKQNYCEKCMDQVIQSGIMKIMQSTLKVT
jgi:deoxycytidylate deaminase